jgi:hypothetical protein
MTTWHVAFIVAVALACGAAGGYASATRAKHNDGGVTVLIEVWSVDGQSAPSREVNANHVLF